ncbi:MAG: tetratricopeptide repeat protein, partial [Promethearchaeota archaeon]
MSNSISNKLEFVKNLIEECNYEEVLQIIKDIEQREDLTPEEMLRILNYKSGAYLGIGQPKKSFEIAEELYQKSQKLNLPHFSVDALFRKEWVLSLGEHSEFAKILVQHESLFNSIPRDDSREYKEREARLLLMKGVLNFWSGNNDVALKHHTESINLSEQIDSISLKYGNFGSMAYIYDDIGEIAHAIEYGEKALSFIPDQNNFAVIARKATIYSRLGMSYYRKGDLDRALEYNIQCLELYKTAKAIGGIGLGGSYANIIRILLAKKDLNQARNYLQKSKEDFEYFESTGNYNELRGYQIYKILFYEFAKALVLKNSDRMRERVEAETILKKIIEEVDPNEILYEYYQHESRVNAIVNLCDMLLDKLAESNNPEILNEINPYITYLITIAENKPSYSLLAETYLLQGRLALIHLNLGEARHLMTKAQMIADEHGLQLLAQQISYEHDKLLEELEIWQTYKNSQISLSERIKHSGVANILEVMEKRRVIDVPEFEAEFPILLAIMSKTGYLVLTNPFSPDIRFDEKRIGEFVSFFNTISDQMFSESLDRAKFGEHTILLKAHDSLSICYL